MLTSDIYHKLTAISSAVAQLVHVDFHNLVHLLDLQLHLVQVLEDVDQLFVARIVPVLPLLLQLHYLILHLLEVLDVLAQLVRVFAFPHAF